MTCDFACWDRIADAINPALALLSLGVLIFDRQAHRVGRQRYALFALALIVAVYAMQWADAQLGIWSRWGGDYSTHTAFALAAAAPMAMLNRRWAAAMALIVVLYVALMLKQRYHSILDVTSTAAYMAMTMLLTFPLWKPIASETESRNAPKLISRS